MSLIQSEKLRDEIDQRLSIYINRIRRRTKCNLNDGALNAEGFFRNFLNLLLNLNLSKDSIEGRNNDTIDLHDIDSKISFQVTANNTSQKVKRTVQLFIKNQKYNQNKELHFMILDLKRNFKFDEFALQEFGVSIHFHDLETIFQKLFTEFDTVELIKPIHNFVIQELEFLTWKDSAERENKKAVAARMDFKIKSAQIIYDTGEVSGESTPFEDAVRHFWEDVEKYKKFKEMDDLIMREDVDDKLKESEYRLSVDYFIKVHESRPNDRELGMAVALSLCLPGPVYAEPKEVHLLITLLKSGHSRVRFRAARAIMIRHQKGIMPARSKRHFINVLLTALNRRNEFRVVKDAIQDALDELQKDKL